jgi:hypothetical protein
MKKKLLRIVSACGLAMLYFGSPSAHAFCTEYKFEGIGVNCVGEGHKKVTEYIEPFLRGEYWSDIWLGNFSQDDPSGDAANDGQRHFESCRFATDGGKGGAADYIRSAYGDAIASLDPADPEPFEAAVRFGRVLHTVQDFYSHSNWINLLNVPASTPLDSTHLFDRSLGDWPLMTPLSSVRHNDVAECKTDDIVVGQIPATGLTPGWSVAQELTSEIPYFMTDKGCVVPGLIVGWNDSGACPDVRAGETIDDYSHDEQGIGRLYRTNRLTHGESKIAGQYDFLHDYNLADAGYQSDRPCHDGYPTYICLQKDHPGRPDYDRAIKLAQYQTAHEWCRFLNLAKQSEFGYQATSILMTMWTKPGNEASATAPHPISTACGTPLEVLEGKPGPIELTVDPRGVAVNNLPAPDGPPGKRFIAAALYTGDFRRSIRREYEDLTDNNVLVAQPMTMCVKPTDQLVAGVWGWDDWREPPPEGPQLYAGYRVLRGETLVLNGPEFQKGESEGSEEDRDLSANFLVTVGGDDPDGDGLTSACGEPYYGTDPIDADSDDDGLNDGPEVNTYGTNPLDDDSDDDGLKDGEEVNTYHTNPLDDDSDDDGLNDGEEVHTYHTNPLDDDSDDDGLNDGEEVHTYGTDPNDADTDDDGLPDGIEVKYGTNPLDSDSDDDGLPDGKDVEWIQNVIAAIPNAAIKPPGGGNRNSMLNLLNDAEALLLKGSKGNRKAALDKLMTLRSRIDGCGAVADGNDWIIDCTIQTEVRMLVDLLIGNVNA